MSETSPPPPEGKYLGWLNAVKGLTISNVLVIGMLVVIAIPAYLVYKALGDEKLLDRFLSTYEEFSSQQAGCVMRHVQERGGPSIWGISTGFAFTGADRYFVNVALDHQPTGDELQSYCEALKLIADKMLADDR